MKRFSTADEIERAIDAKREYIARLMAEADALDAECDREFQEMADKEQLTADDQMRTLQLKDMRKKAKRKRRRADGVEKGSIAKLRVALAEIQTIPIFAGINDVALRK